MFTCMHPSIFRAIFSTLLYVEFVPVHSRDFSVYGLWLQGSWVVSGPLNPKPETLKHTFRSALLSSGPHETDPNINGFRV